MTTLTHKISGNKVRAHLITKETLQEEIHSSTPDWISRLLVFGIIHTYIRLDHKFEKAVTGMPAMGQRIQKTKVEVGQYVLDNKHGITIEESRNVKQNYSIHDIQP